MSKIPSIAMIPSGYKASKLYSVLPTDGTGDFNTSRASIATRVNENGLIEEVAANVPRLDYSNGGCPSLLLEPTATNNLLQSNQFDTTWTLSATIGLTSGQSGVYSSNDSWLLKKTGTGARYINQAISLSSAQYSYSNYLKAESTDWTFLYVSDGTNTVTAYIDLANGVVGTTSGANLDSTKIESVGGGWYRCTLTLTQAITIVRVYPAFANGDVSTGADGGIYIQHAQVEANSYATSLIKTLGTTQTRVADTATGSGSSTVINSTEGVLYAEISAFEDIPSGNLYISLGDGLRTSPISLRLSTDGDAIYYHGGVASSNTVSSVTDGSVDLTQMNKFALRYGSTASDCSLFFNGVKQANSGLFVFGALSTLNELRFSEDLGSFDFYGKTKDLRVYATALSDAELTTLTTI